MIVAITRVKMKPEDIGRAAERFQASVPALVQQHGDWLGARLTADRERGRVAVLGFWRSAAAFEAFATGEGYRELMHGFAQYFTSDPEIEVYEEVLELGRQDSDPARIVVH